MDLLEVPKSDSAARTLIDELLGEQRSLTAVDRFSRAHADGVVPAQEKFYRDLIPLTAPAPGQQYAFEVDLDKCSGCKACVTACHAMNGLDDDESWREVGLLHSEDWRAPFQAHVTTACHHCVEPGCLEGCPVLAYDKDPVTGIVRHLDDQCIGCQYCVMKCPYDVPKYSAKRGIVRKCDMCSTRLSHGEAPACVQSCPSKAIRITVVQKKEILAQYETASTANDFLPASPSPRFTVPTTRYKSTRPLPAGILAGDHAQVSPADSHLPLVFMLVLSQFAVGLSAMAIFIPAKWAAVVSFVTALVAIGSGTLHLGQPLKAWRCFLGWRQSWFSREIIAFGIFMPVSALNVASCWLPSLAMLQHPLAWLTTLIGMAAVACSAMIYADTHREFWRASQSFGKFFGSAALLGCAGTLMLLVLAGVKEIAWLALLVAFVSVVKLVFEHRIFRHLVDEETPAPSPLSKTARLLESRLGKFARLRIGFGLAGGVLMPFLLATNISSPIMAEIAALVMFSLCLLGELTERYLFFTAVAPAKMPGGVAA